MPGQCTEDGCERPTIARGICRSHYSFYYWRKQLTPRPTPLERFLSKLEITEACWLWKGVKVSDNYGSFYADGTKGAAHRWSYEWFVGPIPEGLQIDHLCRVHDCVNPDHLEPVTQHENWRRGEAPSAIAFRRGTCKWGHPWDEKNTRWLGKKRTCRECHRLNSAKRYAQKRSANSNEAKTAT